MIRKAIFPVAGLGTRFLPATKANPKEMLPVVDKPLIQYAVEEAIQAGITDLIFVTSSSKRAIEDHFDRSYELEATLVATGKQDLLELVEQILPPGIRCVYLRQPKALGLGHAVLCAHHLIEDDHFAVLLADDLINCKQSCMTQMVNAFQRQPHCRGLLAVEKIPKKFSHLYGMIGIGSRDKKLVSVQSIIEKPRQDQIPSPFGVVGRYILPKTVFMHLENLYKASSESQEIHLTDAIANLLLDEAIYAYEFEGQRYDCGNKLGYLKAIVDLGMQHAVFGPKFTHFLQTKFQHELT